MKLSPWILGAAVLVPIAGGVAGANLSTDPIGIGADVTATLPESNLYIARSDAELSAERLPDHYAMETPDGVIEVADLAMRGRYRNRRGSYYGWTTANFDLEAELAQLDGRWSDDALDSRAVAALDAQQPRPDRNEAEPRYAEAPHYAAMQRANVGTAGAVSVVSGSSTPPTPIESAAPVDIASHVAVTPVQVAQAQLIEVSQPVALRR